MNTTVLIPTHGRPTLLERTLESLSQCRLPDSYTELVVIENGSRAGAEELVEALPERLKARYMHRSRGNKSYALNQALKTIADGLVVFFDDDVRVSPETLFSYAEAAEEYGPGHFFGGPVEIDREADPPESLSHLFPRSVRGYDLVESRMGDKYLGFNWAAYRSDLVSVGGFNTELGPGVDTATNVGDESELQGRLLEIGCEGIDVRRARVSHFVPAENTTLSWLLRRRIQGGGRVGLEAEASWICFGGRILWQTMVSLFVAGKAIITLDKEKMAFFFANTFHRIGVVKGYIWQSMNGGRTRR